MLNKNIYIFFLLFFQTTLYAFVSPEIWVYHGDGVSEESYRQIVGTLRDFLPKAQIKSVLAKDVTEQKLNSSISLFVIPGGRDLPYVRDLGVSQTLAIQSYLRNGGSFLGLCAGAYFASQRIEFDKGGPLQVLGERPLGLYPGTSVGPVLAQYAYQSCAGCRAAKIHWKNNPKDLFVYYDGGGFFQDAEKWPQVSVLATYEDPQAIHLPAIVEIAYGKGHVILSGVHFEYQTKLILENEDPRLPAIKKNIDSTSKIHRKLIRSILSQLQLPVGEK